MLYFNKTPRISYHFYLVSIVLIFFSSCGSVLDYYNQNPTPWEIKKIEIQQAIDTLKTDFEKVNYIRKFVARQVNVGNNKIHLNNYSDLSSADFYRLFSEDSITVYCGGTAYFLSKVYSEFGFKSYTYDCGDPITYATHQFNLVRIIDNGIPKLIIEDAYLDQTYTYSDNSPLEFEKVIYYLKQRDTDSIKILKGFTEGKGLIKNKTTGWRHWNLDKREPYKIYRSNNKNIPFIVHQYISVDFYMNSNGLRKRYCSFLEKEGLKCDLRYLLLFPQGNEDWINQLVFDIIHDSKE